MNAGSLTAGVAGLVLIGPSGKAGLCSGGVTGLGLSIGVGFWGLGLCTGGEMGRGRSGGFGFDGGAGAGVIVGFIGGGTGG